MSYVGKSTFGDFTKTAKEAAVKKGLILIEPDQPKSPQPTSSGTTVATTSGSTSSHFFSSLTSDISGMAQSTSSMFSGFFGQKQSPTSNQQQKQISSSTGNLSTSSKLLGFDPFPNRKGLVERTPLIRHAGPKHTQEELHRQQQAERTTSNSENQAFLKDVSSSIN